MDSKRSIRLSELKRSDIEKAFKKTVDKVDVPIEVPMGKLVLVTEDLYRKALEIPKECFIDDEPLGKSIGLKWSDEFGSYWLNTLKANLSIMLLNKDSGEVIGLKAIRLIKSGEKQDLKCFKDIKLREIFELLSMGDAEFFEKYNTGEAFQLVGLGVRKEYKRRGIGTFLVQVTLKFLQELGVSPFHIKVEGTSMFSKKCFEKCGFDAIKEVPYQEYKKNGKVVFDNTGEHKSVKIYGKCVVTDAV